MRSQIVGQHRDRWAVVYVRPSALQQLERHQESTRLQDGLVDHALAWGWAQQRVLVIDEDLGKSGTPAAGRPGFQRLVAEVSLDHVGIVLGLEMSRWARSHRDWHQLLAVCALGGTVIGDRDGVYDPRDYNDRLVWGLKGTMSEAELHVLKQRLLAGQQAKAKRGELRLRVPVGDVRRPSGEVGKEPEEQAQVGIALVFEQVARLGTIGGVWRYLVRHGLQWPCRVAAGLNKGDLVWRRPNQSTRKTLLHHPMYAGAYVYGQRPTEARRKPPGRPATGRRVAPPTEWPVLLQDPDPAYITWAQFERNQRQLEATCNAVQGAIRRGPSLLAGLVRCGRCGLRMTAASSNNGTGWRYMCHQEKNVYGGPRCQSLVGGPLEKLVAALVLQALAPAALELSLQVAADVEAERPQVHQQWPARLARAQYAVERAARQYNTVAPENRVVARTLERHWEEALAEAERLQADYARFLTVQPTTLSSAERDAIRRLASDIPALWRAPGTTDAERQAIIRQVVDHVVVTVHGESAQGAVRVHGLGGHRTEATLLRPVARLEQLRYSPQLLARAAALYTQGADRPTIAQTLHREGWRPAKRTTTFSALMVGRLLARQGLRYIPPGQAAALMREAQEWTLQELEQLLGIPEETLYAWLCHGRLTARQVTTASHPRWLIWADAGELDRLRTLRNTPRTWKRPAPRQTPVDEF